MTDSAYPANTLSERALRYDHEHSRSLRALAYRMLGSRAEAEDIIQEAWLRWAEVDESSVQHAGAYLSRLVTNLCLDRLASAAHRREHYVGVWLPEPLLDDEAAWSPGPEMQTEFAQDVSVAFMLALERLSPLERAAFLLHEVFDLDFEEVGRRLERSPAACRQLASRARQHVKVDYARREVEDAEGERLYAAFSAAVQSGDIDALSRVLTEDALFMSDGGGKVPAVMKPMQGGALIAKTFIGFALMPIGRLWQLRPARINGMPGCLIINGDTGELIQTVVLAPSVSEPGRIAALYVQRNPEKLQGVVLGEKKD